MIKVLGGFILGVAVGILIAPSAGGATRKRIVSRSRVYSQQAVEAVRQYLENLKTGYKTEAGAESSEASV
jgi:gas vesicle protein